MIRIWLIGLAVISLYIAICMLARAAKRIASHACTDPFQCYCSKSPWHVHTLACYTPPVKIAITVLHLDMVLLK